MRWRRDVFREFTGRLIELAIFAFTRSTADTETLQSIGAGLVAGLKCKRAAVVFDRAGVISRFFVGRGAVDVGHHELRIDLDGPARVGDRQLALAVLQIGNGAIAVGLRIGGIELDGLGIILDLALPVALRAIGAGTNSISP